MPMPMVAEFVKYKTKEIKALCRKYGVVFERQNGNICVSNPPV